MIAPDMLGKLVTLKVTALYRRYPDALLLPREQVRREAAEQALRQIRRRMWEASR
jgi:hypothetical protein